MKKAYSAAMFFLWMFALRIAVYADLAPLPKDYIFKERLHNALETPVVPFILILVIVAVVILVKVLRNRNQK